MNGQEGHVLPGVKAGTAWVTGLNGTALSGRTESSESYTDS